MDLEQERELVERARSSTEAFAELYDHYYPRLFGYVLRRTASIEVAQDVTSEVVFKAMKNLRRFEWRGVPFSSWLFRIATHEIANHYSNTRQGQFSLEEVSDSISIDDCPAESDVHEAEADLRRHEEYLSLHASISRLPVKYQEVITLRFFEDKQINEIAQILGKREGTVKSLLHRAVKKLGKLME